MSHTRQHFQVVGTVADGVAVGQVRAQGLGHGPAAGRLGIAPHGQLEHAAAPVDDLAQGRHLRQKFLPPAVRPHQDAHLVKVEIRVAVRPPHPDAAPLQALHGVFQLPVQVVVGRIHPDVRRLLKVHIHQAPPPGLQDFPAGVPVKAHVPQHPAVQLDILAAGAHQPVECQLQQLGLHGDPGPPGIDNAVMPRLPQLPHRLCGGGRDAAVHVHDGAVNVEENDAHSLSPSV